MPLSSLFAEAHGAVNDPPAPFEYLRDFGCVVARAFFSTPFGSHDYARAVVREHRNYLSAMRYLCVDRFCGGGSRSTSATTSVACELLEPARCRRASGSHAARPCWWK